MDNYTYAVNYNTLLVALNKTDSFVYELFKQCPLYSSKDYARLCSFKNITESNIQKIYEKVNRVFEKLPKDVIILKDTDSVFPDNVPNIPFLYLRGNVNLLNKRGVSIVGTKFPSKRGKTLARLTATEIGKKDFTVISGLALGIDGCAHLQTLKDGKSTLAVLGTPINSIYPHEHEKLQEMIAQNGLLVSMFSPCIQVKKYFFMVRNILMSKLNFASVVVESEDGGGGVSQARYTEKEGKKVFIFKEVYENRTYLWPRSFKEPVIVKNPSQIPLIITKGFKAGKFQSNTPQPDLFQSDLF